MKLLQELKDNHIIKESYIPKIYCKAFEDNSGALEMARTPKMRPRTKFMNVKYHHFRSYVADGSIEIFAIDTLDQLADLFTKPLGLELFYKFTSKIFGWTSDSVSKKLNNDLDTS